VSGFLSLPDGTFAEDPEGALEYDRPANIFFMKGPPVLKGSGLSFDGALKRWIPASLNATAPDGLRYAYIDHPGYQLVRIHIVDVASGQDRVVLTTDFHEPYWIVAFTSEGLYLTQRCPSGCPVNVGKLWLLNPDTGALRLVSSRRGSGWLISRGLAFGIDTDLSGAWTLMALNLASGQIETWGTTDVRSLVGADIDGRPLGWIGDRMYSFRRPGSAVELKPAGAKFTGGFATATFELDGAWVGATGGGLFYWQDGYRYVQVGTGFMYPVGLLLPS
jgi:hypothetical protein